MPTLPARPSLEHLKKQAKRLHKAAHAKDDTALTQVGPYFGDPARITLQQAQLVVARDHGFSSWTRLKRHIASGAGAQETAEKRANRFLDLASIHYAPDPNMHGPDEFEQAAALLAAHPEIARHSLHTAAAAGDLSVLQNLLSDPAHDVNERSGPHHWTPLMYAAYARLPGVSSWPAGQALIAAGADPNAHTMFFGTYRFTVLTGVFGDGEGGLVRQPPHPDMVPFARALLDAGANPNDSQGAYNRCFTPDDTHLELMLEYGLKDSAPSDWWLVDNPDRDPQEHRTMHFQLIIALRWGFADRARLLIEHGVDINTPDNNYYPTYTVGYTPYQVALLRGMPEIAALIKAKGGSAEALDAAEQFQAACMSGDLNAARALAPDHLGSDPARHFEMLCEACGNGNLPAVRTMIAIGFDLSMQDHRSPLHMAAFKGHIDVINALIDAGADTARRDKMYNTPPVVHAMHNHQHDAVTLLMEHPMDIFAAAAMDRLDHVETAVAKDHSALNARFRSVRTSEVETYENDWVPPLWFAAMNGRHEMVTALLARGADPSITDPDGRTIADHAETAGHIAIAQDLRRSG